MIAAADRRWAIGKNNGLLYRVPEDMRHFRELTTGNTVIYGRKTLESFPGGKPLRDRLNIVISRSYEPDSDGLLAARNPEEALRIAEEADPYHHRTIFVCGGESIYRQLLPYCDKAVITRIEAETADADAFLPDLDRETGWSRVSWTEQKSSVSGLSYRFVTYHHK